ncbi:MAG TPA: hypothetical protein PLU72_03855 [Candidatus Ozemobacteraceae bacterium]|nr:hypothetical protein [Candidatus Ozemobacteraceae bacterium]
MEGNEEIRSAWKKMVVTAILLVGIAGTCGYGLFRAAEREFRNVTGDTLVWVATTTNARLMVPPPLRQHIAEEVASLSRSVAAGTSPLLPSLRLMRSFERGPLYLALLLRGFDQQCRNPDISRLIGRFFADWKALGQPDDSVASLSRLLTVEAEELAQTPSGLALPEFVFVLRTDWNEAALASVATFFADFKTASASSGTGSQLSNEITMPDPIAELKAEIIRLGVGNGR